MVADHLSRLELHINDSFLDKQLLTLSHTNETPWFVDIVNYLAAKIIPFKITFSIKKKGVIFLGRSHSLSIGMVLIKLLEDVSHKLKFVLSFFIVILWSGIVTLVDKGQL